MQALNDSGLGEALIGGGLMDELRQPVFSLGLKGVDPKNCEKVRASTPAFHILWKLPQDMRKLLGVSVFFQRHYRWQGDC